MTVGSLFAGIGGFDLGLERAGFTIKWQVEIDEYCRAVLAKHWPRVKRYGDIRAIDWRHIEPVDVLCGGFPCQPFSLAGQRRGTSDDRYLWPEMRLAVLHAEPTWVIAENVPGLIGPALDEVLSDLEAAGYEVGTLAVPACAFDAPHIRQRIWILAHRNRKQLRDERRTGLSGTSGAMQGAEEERERIRVDAGNGGQDVADADTARRHGRTRMQRAGWWGESEDGGGWQPEPRLGRVAYGIPHRVDRLRGLGNAIVPQIAEWIGRQIMKVDQ